MAAHAEDALRGARISQVLDLLLAVAAAKAGAAERLVAGEDGEVLDFVTAGIAAVCAVVANERAVAEQEQVRVGVEQCPFARISTCPRGGGAHTSYHRCCIGSSRCASDCQRAPAPMSVYRGWCYRARTHECFALL